ncbi:DUF4832 domain-containing protein [Actinoplanes sp. NPDC049596]|uniref:DUF4832 domain-containing protein n=1 Tax=unclassified Actinoplanes TaxID=2626549 RepID=UPI003416B06B
MRFLPAAAVAVAVLLPGTAVAATPSTATVTYAASAASIANPGRGFFTYTETHFGSYTPLVDADLAAARVNQARSLVYRIFYLEKYQAVDQISAADLALVRADFAAARTAGVKLIVRFAYASESDADAPEARVLKHIAQLGPILKAGADVITAVQAGFVGRWGEWYYSRNFGTEGTPDWTSRGHVLAALLAATAPSTVVQVRTPAIKRRLAPDVARVGVHDDCFLAGTDDYGTFTGDDAAWLASSAVLVGGETCDVSARSAWPNARAEMARYHWTYLNPSFNTDVLDSWGAAGRAEADRRLGYRIRLVKAVLPTAARAGSRVTATITLVNDGYAAPVANRPVRLIVGSRSVVVNTDVRTWTPGKLITLKVSFIAASGAYALSLPDPAATLAAKPAYAIQLANPQVWNPATGRNSLGRSLTVK